MKLQKRAAIKELFLGREKDYLNQDIPEIERIKNEAQIMAKADGLPGFARIYDMFYENNTGYIIENYIEGRTLAEIQMDLPCYEYSEKFGIIERKKDLETWLPLVRPVMSSLEQLHKIGIVHGDISSNNIMIDRHGKTWIVDFGRAVEMGKKLGVSDVETVGPGALVPPEISKIGTGQTAQIGPWTDVYCVCAMLYHLLGIWSFNGLPDLRDIPEKYRTVFARGLAEEPRDRIQNMAELSKAFQLVQDSAEQPSETKPVQPPVFDGSEPQPLRRLTFRYGQMFDSESGGCLIFESGCVIGKISDFHFSFESRGTVFLKSGRFELSSRFAEKVKMSGDPVLEREKYLQADYIIYTGNYKQNIDIEAAKLLHMKDGYRISFHDAEFTAKRGKESWTFYTAETMVARIVKAPDGINLLVYEPLTELETLVLSFFTWLMP